MSGAREGKAKGSGGESSPMMLGAGKVGCAGGAADTRPADPGGIASPSPSATLRIKAAANRVAA
jgi:hypothetical protein